MERMLASPADAEIILKLYELRTEKEMRQARAWMTGQWWPNTADEFLSVAQNPASEHNAWFRQVATYWEMAAALVLLLYRAQHKRRLRRAALAPEAKLTRRSDAAAGLGPV